MNEVLVYIVMWLLVVLCHEMGHVLQLKIVGCKRVRLVPEIRSGVIGVDCDGMYNLKYFLLATVSFQGIVAGAMCLAIMNAPMVLWAAYGVMCAIDIAFLAEFFSADRRFWSKPYFLYENNRHKLIRDRAVMEA